MTASRTATADEDKQNEFVHESSDMHGEVTPQDSWKRSGSFFLNRNEPFLEADEITWELGKDDEDPYGLDREWRHNLFMRFPRSLATRLAAQYQRTYLRDGRHVAELWLLETAETLFGTSIASAFANTIDFGLALSERRIKAVADEASLRTVSLQDMPDELKVATIRRLCRRYGISQPGGYGPGVIARLACPLWWRRHLRRDHGRRFENGMRGATFVHRTEDIYASDETVDRRLEQRARARELMRILVAEDDLGQTYSLQEIAEKGQANPRNRRACLMARISGFERIALSLGFCAEFYTVTCPSRMHASRYYGGKQNPRFDRTTVRAAQAYLCRQWQRARAKADRQNIRYFGFRVAEPQHDGTPHWHLLLFVHPDDRAELEAIVHHYALQVDGDEPGAVDHRVKRVAIDYNKGTAVGYLAKYISKNIDGFGIDADEYGNAIDAAVVRIDAWASTFGIRQFQQIGGPSVGTWHELRRLYGANGGLAALGRASEAADSGDWAAYVEAQGGPVRRRTDRPIQLLRIWSDEPGKYGEPKGFKVIGVECMGLAVPTRFRTWSVRAEPNASATGARAPLDRGAGGHGTRKRAAPAGRSPAGVGRLRHGRRGPHVKRRASPGSLESCQ